MTSLIEVEFKKKTVYF